jgi:transposase
MEHPCFVGIDVSKAHLDVHVLPSGDSFRVGHDDAGFVTLIARVRPFPATVVVLEATGGYEVPVRRRAGRGEAARRRDQPPADPRFARATGQLARTDALDARVIALFAEAVRPIVRPLPDDQARALGDLVTRRRLAPRPQAVANRLTRKTVAQG